MDCPDITGSKAPIAPVLNTPLHIYDLNWFYILADLDFSLDHSICTELKKFKVKPNQQGAFKWRVI